MKNLSVYGVRLVKEQSGRYDFSDSYVNTPAMVAKLANEVFDLENRAEEVFAMFCLDTKNRITGAFIVSQGTINNSVVHPREVYKRALLQNSAKIILCHNHPSGVPEPSKEDIDVTEHLVEAGNILGIKVLDHVIVGYRGITSFKERLLI
jgi:DNA repair protein RadC